MKKINQKDNRVPLAIIVGAVIIAASILFVYNSTPQAQLMKSCKKITKNLSKNHTDSTSGQLIMTYCLNGQLK